MTEAAAARLRSLCLALPEAAEQLLFDAPSYRVRDKIFARYTERDGWRSVWLKAPPGSQAVLVGADPRRFFVPPYLGPKGWVGIRLDVIAPEEPDWGEVETLVRRSYRLVAPQRLAALLV